MKRRLTLSLWLFGACAALRAQNPTPEGLLYPTQNSARVNGVKIQVASDGAIWFLESSADTIARLKDGVIRQWQIRPADQLGANPVDFELDGDLVWLIESGESQIPAGTSAFGRLDTASNQLTEWVIPGAIPAAFYRAPDGLLWLPQSAAVLQSMGCSVENTAFVDCPEDKLTMTSYRSTGTYAYADMVVAPDGAFWLADFGDNRIVRWVPGADTETSWTFFPLTGGRLNPSQIQFDADGKLWISQRSASRMDRFDPATSAIASYGHFISPIHFDIFQGRLYVTSIATTSQVTVLDPNLAPIDGTLQLEPLTLSVGHTTPTIPVTIRSQTIVPTDFTSDATPISAGEFTVTNPGTTPGMLTTTLPSSNTYGITVSGGRLWVGTDARLAAVNLQATGNATDQSVPMATTLAGTADSKIRIDVTVSNRGVAALSGQVQYLYSPAAAPARASFTLAPNATSLIADAFGNLAGPSTLLDGPVRLGTTTANATDLVSTVRSVRVLPDGGTFGYLLPAQSATTSLLKDSTTTLFTGPTDSAVSILNLYSLVDAKATLTLFAPDGTQRGAQSLDIAKNTSLSFNLASAPFGAPAEPGDAVRVAVTDGTLQADVLVLDGGTNDILPSLPAAATTGSVIPWVGSFANGDVSFVSDLLLSNPSTDTSAGITVTFYGVGATGPPPTASVTLTPLQTLNVPNVLSSLFAISAGQGALVLSSTIPVAATARIATHVTAGDYGTFANAIDAAAGIAGGQSAFAMGLPQTSTRTGLLLLYNSGSAGTVTVTGFLADGTQAGQFGVAMGAQSAQVVSSVFGLFGVSNQPAGRVRVDVPAGLTVFGWAAATDVTGDIDLTPLQ